MEIEKSLMIQGKKVSGENENVSAWHLYSKVMFPLPMINIWCIESFHNYLNFSTFIFFQRLHYNHRLCETKSLDSKLDITLRQMNYLKTKIDLQSCYF